MVHDYKDSSCDADNRWAITTSIFKHSKLLRKCTKEEIQKDAQNVAEFCLEQKNIITGTNGATSMVTVENARIHGLERTSVRLRQVAAFKRSLRERKAIKNTVEI